MVFAGDALHGRRGHLLEFDRADTVHEQTVGASDKCLHLRVVQYRFWPAENSESAGARFGISVGDGAGYAGLQNESADRKNRCSHLFAQDLFARQ